MVYTSGDSITPFGSLHICNSATWFGLANSNELNVPAIWDLEINLAIVIDSELLRSIHIEKANVVPDIEDFDALGIVGSICSHQANARQRQSAMHDLRGMQGIQCLQNLGQIVL